MCGPSGGGGGSNDAVKYQREQEAERQRRIENGKMQLEKMFAGLEGADYRITNPWTTYSKDQYMNKVRQALEGNVNRTSKEVPIPQRVTTAQYRGPGGYDSGLARSWARRENERNGPQLVTTAQYRGPGGYDSGPARSWADRENARRKREWETAGDAAAAQARRSPGGYDSGVQNMRARNAREAAQRTATRTVTSQSLTPAGRKALKALGLTDEQIGGTGADDYEKFYRALVNQPGQYERVEGVRDPIWKKQQQAYLDYAKPQLEDQFGDARDQLTFALARQGQSRGSLAGDRSADLNRDYDLRRQEVADKARGVANQARGDIASQKQSLLQMLTASADPGATATAARSAVGALRSTPEFSPLGPLFQNATAGLASGMGGYQTGRLDQEVQGITYGRDPDRGSGRVIR